jgi:hypothetical protein
MPPLAKKAWADVAIEDSPKVSPRKGPPLNEIDELMNISDSEHSPVARTEEQTQEVDMHQQQLEQEELSTSKEPTSLQASEGESSPQASSAINLHISKRARQASAQEEQPTVLSEEASITTSEDESNLDEEEASPVYMTHWLVSPFRLLV